MSVSFPRLLLRPVTWPEPFVKEAKSFCLPVCFPSNIELIGSLDSRNYLLISLGVWKFMTKILAGLVSPETFLLG